MPFTPNDEVITEKLEEKSWHKLRAACIESTTETDFFCLDLNVRRLRTLPPTVNLTLPNLNLAVPPVPQGLDQTALQDYINNVLTPLIKAQLTVAAEAAANALRSTLPQQGFEHIQTNARWEKNETED